MQKNEKTRLNADEYHAMLHLCASLQAIKKSEALKKRVASIENCSKTYNGAKGMLRKTIDEIFESMPEKQFESFIRNLGNMRYSVTVRNVAGMSEKDDGRWLSVEALELICDATKDHCLVCSKNVQEQRQCKLAKALDELPIRRADENARGCRYFGGI